MDSKCNMWQVDSLVVVVVENREPRVFISYMYIKHSHRVYGVSNICHVLVLNQTSYDNAYPTLWHHVVLCVEQKTAIMETGLYYKAF